jgi:class 3 adenylate cyclase/tetratricopeptide (TPR) repeat protein
VILFADLSGYTALSETMDPEEIRDLMNRWYEGLTRIVHRYGGYVDKYIGDCLMALFGAPVAHEDDPQRAVLAAGEMQSWTAEFARSVSGGGPVLQARIGIHMGEVVAGRVGGSDRSDYSVMGDAVNVASRLESSAEPGTVLVSEPVYLQTRQAFRYSSPQSFQVKGKALPISAYLLLGEGPLPAEDFEEKAGAAPFVGRGREMGVLLDVVRSVLTERDVRRVHVMGEAGVGKTRFLKEFSRRLPPGVRSWFISGQPQQREAAYAPFRTLLAEVFPEISGMPEFPDWSPYLQTFLHPAEAPPEILHQEVEDRQRLIRKALHWVLRSLTDAGPAVLCLDNAHWMDSATRHFLRHLSGDSGPLPLVTIQAERSEGTGSPPDPPDGELLILPPLTPDESRGLLHGLLQNWEGPASLEETILLRSGGNPLYLEEMVHTLQETGVLFLRDGRWVSEASSEIPIPDTLQLLLTARIDRLSEPARQWLRVASVQGVQPVITMVEEMFPAPEGAVSPVQELIQCGFLLPTGEADRLQFTQTLLQEVAYQGLLRSRRRRYHAQIGEAMERRGGDLPLEVMAYHFHLSDDGDRAVRYALLAGERTLALYDVPSATRYFQQSLSHIHRMKDLPAAAQTERAARAFLCEVFLITGRFDEARGEGEAALALVPNHPDNEAESARLHRLIGLVHTRQGDPRTAHPWFDAALRLLTRTEEAPIARERARTLLNSAFAHFRCGSYEEARERAAEALGLAVPKEGAAQTEDHREEGQAHHLMGLIAYVQGDFRAARAAFTTSLRIRAGISDPAGTASSLNMLGNLARDEGALSEAEERFGQAVALWEKIGDVTQMAGGLNNLANLLTGQGKYVEARGLYHRTLECADRCNDAFARAMARANLGFLSLETSDLEAARTYLTEGVEEARSRGFQDLLAYLHCGIGEYFLHRGDVKGAADSFQEALTISRRIGHRHQEALALRGLGRLAVDEGRYDAAEGHLQEGLALFRALQRTQEVGRTCLALARLYRLTGGTNQAAAFIAEAKRLFTPLQASADLQKAEALEREVNNR